MWQHEKSFACNARERNPNWLIPPSADFMAPVNHETLTLSTGASGSPPERFHPGKKAALPPGAAELSRWAPLGVGEGKAKSPCLGLEMRIGQKVCGGKGNCVSKNQQPLIHACPLRRNAVSPLGNPGCLLWIPLWRNSRARRGLLFSSWLLRPHQDSAGLLSLLPNIRLSLSLKNCIHFFILLFYNYQHIFVCVCMCGCVYLIIYGHNKDWLIEECWFLKTNFPWLFSTILRVSLKFTSKIKNRLTNRSFFQNRKWRFRKEKL